MSGLLSLGGVVGQGAAFLLTMPFLTRAFSLSEFGLLVTSLAIAQAVALVANLGAPVALTTGARFLRADRAAGARVLGFGLASAFALAGCFAVLGLLGPFGRSTTLLVYGGATGGCLAAATVVQAELRALGRHGYASGLAGFTWLAGMTLGTLLALAADSEAKLLLGLAGCSIAATLAGISWPNFLSACRADRYRAASSAMLRRGWMLLPHAVAMFAIGSGDRLIIPLADTTAEVARYQVAYSVGAVTLLGVSALGMVWGPNIHADGSSAVSRQSWLDSLIVSLRLGVLALAALVLVAPVAVLILAPASFGRPLLALLAVLIGAACLPYVCYQGLVHIALRDRPGYRLSVTAPLVAVVSLALCYAAVLRFGILGAAAATLFSYTALWVLVGIEAGSGWLTASAVELARALVSGLPLFLAAGVASWWLGTDTLGMVARLALIVAILPLLPWASRPRGVRVPG